MRTISISPVVLIALWVSLSTTLKAQQQTPKVEVYEKIHIAQKKPIPYPATREADVMYEKIVWRMLDLREKMNLPLYYPTKPIGDRMNFITMVFRGIDAESLSVYDANAADEFSIPMSKEDIEKIMGNVETTTKITDANGVEKDTVVKGERKFDEIKKLLIKEKWFFDRNYSTMQVRIIGICPIRVFKKEIKGVEAGSDAEAEMSMSKVFWINYNEFRNLFTKNPVFNRNNDAQQTSFDDLFMQRRFSSYIYAESNVYDNRRIEDYTTGYETLLEGERIKNDMVNFEHDLWEY